VLSSSCMLSFILVLICDGNNIGTDPVNAIGAAFAVYRSGTDFYVLLGLIWLCPNWCGFLVGC
jgi:hypothetical protein